MNTPRFTSNSLARTAVTAAVLGLSSSAAFAALVVDLQSNTGWVTTNTSGRGSSSDTTDYNGDTFLDRRSQVAFSTSSPLLNNPQNTVQSGRFFGGSVAFTTGDAVTTPPNHFVNNRVVEGGAGFADTYELGSSAASTHIFRSAVLWQKADFLAGGSTQQVNITSDTAFTLRGQNVNTGNNQGRWLVQVGSTYYVSNATFTLGAIANIASSNLTSTTWAAIDLSSALSSYSSPSLSFSSLALTDIQAVGFYVVSSATNSNGRFRMESFSADLTAIPEPSAFAALAGLGALGFVAARRRRRA